METHNIESQEEYCEVNTKVDTRGEEKKEAIEVKSYIRYVEPTPEPTNEAADKGIARVHWKKEYLVAWERQQRDNEAARNTRNMQNIRRTVLHIQNQQAARLNRAAERNLRVLERIRMRMRNEERKEEEEEIRRNNINAQLLSSTYTCPHCNLSHDPCWLCKP